DLQQRPPGAGAAFSWVRRRYLRQGTLFRRRPASGNAPGRACLFRQGFAKTDVSGARRAIGRDGDFTESGARRVAKPIEALGPPWHLDRLGAIAGSFRGALA